MECLVKDEDENAGTKSVYAWADVVVTHDGRILKDRLRHTRVVVLDPAGAPIVGRKNGA